MANRYWVGGTGTWNTSSTTNWSASTGGASGASVPTAADSVFFDQAGTYTVTCTGALNCLDITVSAGVVTFANGTSPTFNIAGSMSLLAGTVWSATGTLTWSATVAGKTITTNGTQINGLMSFSGSGSWTLGSALNTGTNALSFSGGTFNTGNYAMSIGAFNSTSGTRTINLGSSSISITGSSPVFFSNATTLTFNAGTSTFNCTNNTNTFTGGDKTFYNVTFANTANSTISFVGTNTFNDITVAANASASNLRVACSFSANQTINGILSTTGTAGNRPVFFSGAIGFTLTINSAPNLTDAIFGNVYVVGTAAPISGTRIGNFGNCSGITFSTPRNCYWVATSSSYHTRSGVWSNTDGGVGSTDYQPLPQDTAIVTNTRRSALVTQNEPSGLSYIGAVDCSTVTSAFTFSVSGGISVYGNFTLGSGVVCENFGSVINFLGNVNGGSQIVTSAGKQLGSMNINTLSTGNGTVVLADAYLASFGLTFYAITVTNGTFDTGGFAVTALSLTSNSGTVRTINLNASTVTLTSGTSPVVFVSTNLTFNAGTSTLAVDGSNTTFAGVGLTFYNVTFTSSSFNFTYAISGTNTFNNLTFTAASSTGNQPISISANQTINGTLTLAGSSEIRRRFVSSSVTGTQRTLTVNSLSANYCDFRDIVIAGAASGSSPTNAGDCGGNSGITFPASKTVYWNLAGTQDFTATGWATSSGGSPATGNFPLAQDTAIFDNTGAAGTVTIPSTGASNFWNFGTIDASLRTSAMTLTNSASTNIYGDWKYGTGVTSGNNGSLYFSKNGTQTITSNGVTFSFFVRVANINANVQLADALSITSTGGLLIDSGTFDAVTYNVTIGVLVNGSTSTTLKMGSGTWTLAGTGTVWNCNTAPTIIAGTSTIVLSDTSTTARTFTGGGRYYNKLTIGGATGTSALTFTGSANVFGELASTKTVAHTIDFGTTSHTFGKWSVTGTAGNVVTITGTSTASVIAGPAVTGIDYLAMGSWGINSGSPGEFYAGANSTGTAAAPVYRTAAPAPRTLYWVGGTGNWSSTTKWSTSSGGASGAAIPTSLDSVIFNSASNATAYTATIDAGVTPIARCAAFTMAGPASGNVTWAGSVGIAFHGNVSFAATGITRTYSGTMNCAGNASYTFTTNGLVFSNNANFGGIGSTWTLGSALTFTGLGTPTVTYGTFDTSSSGNYPVTCPSSFASTNSNVRTINLNASTLSFGGFISFNTQTNLTFNAGTSQINGTGANAGLAVQTGTTFYNVAFTSTALALPSITGENTFNNLSVTGRTTIGIGVLSLSANQTINGALIVSAGTEAAYRMQISSNAIGTPRTLTCAAKSLTDVDFRDITAAGVGSPFTGTRLGNCGGNTNITFPAAKTVYYRQTGSNDWGVVAAGSWSPTSGSYFDATMFPLAQDTAVFPAATYPASGSTVTINAAYNIGTIDMSLRTSNTMTLANGTNAISVFGNWINGTGITLSGTNQIIFAGRTAQTITSAGKAFTQFVYIYNLGSSVAIQDALITTYLNILAGTFSTNNFNITSTSNGFASNSTTLTRSLNLGSSTFAVTGSWNVVPPGFTATGTGVISMNTNGAKTFAGGGVSYSGITLNQGNAGTLTISGNNTFANITNTSGVATTISLFSTTQTVGAFTATGTAGNLLTITGTSAAAPATLIYTGSGAVSGLDYLVPTFIRAYSPTTTWYAGANSTNGGTNGWIFSAYSPGGIVYNVNIAEAASGVDSVVGYVAFYSAVQEFASGVDQVDATQTYLGVIAETGSGVDSASASFTVNANASETASGIDSVSSSASLGSSVSEAASGADAISSAQIFTTDVTEAGSGVDQVNAAQGFASSISESLSGVDLVSTSFTANSSISETASGIDAVSSVASFGSFVSETASGLDAISSAQAFATNISEAGSGIDQIDAAQTFATNVDEAGSGIDQVDASQEFASSISETGSGLDQVDANFTVNSNASETASGVDEVFSAATFATDIAESGSGVDETSALQTFTTNIAESASGVDQADSAQTFITNVAEAGSGIDQIDASQDFSSNISEAGSGVDEINANFTVNSDVLEAASGVDAISSFAIFTPSIDEAASGIDSVSSAQTFVTDVSEAGSGLDQIDAAQSFVSSVSETASGQDEDSVAASTFNAYAVETASGVDSDSVAASTFNAYSDESASGLDDINAKQVFGSAVAEEASGIDNISAAQSFATSVSEAGSGTDQVDSAQSFASSITENASGVDSDSVADSTFNAYADESASGLDAVSSGASFGSAVDENASAVDAISSAQTFVTSILETAEGLDSTSVAASIFNASLAEAASGVDSISSNSAFGASIAESASGVDSIFSSATFVSDIAETASGVDSISAAQGFAVLIDENASGIDVFTVSASIFNAAFTDSASGIDIIQPNFTYFITVSEGVNAQDLIFARYLWELIDNTETSDWGVINDTQTASWSQIDDTQALNWQNVGNTQTATWSQIDDNESGNWEQI